MIRAVYFGALALWVGGLATISFVVAPTAFEQAPSREVAGKIVGGSLRAFGKVELACGAIALLAAVLLRRERFGAVRLSALGAMVAVASAYIFWVYPQAGTNPAYHRGSVILVGANILVGGALLLFSAATVKSRDGS